MASTLPRIASSCISFEGIIRNQKKPHLLPLRQGHSSPTRKAFSSLSSTPVKSCRVGMLGRVKNFCTRASASVASPPQPSKENVEKEDMNGKICIVTGANTGMGIVIARELALLGANVILACRSETRGKDAEESIWRNLKAVGASGTADFATLDLSSLSSVRSFVEWFTSKYDHLDCLINNAGIMVPPHSFTVDGYESQFQVNHLSHYLLTRLLTPSLLKSEASPKVIHISSLASERVTLSKGEFQRIARCPPEAYNAWSAYRQSKLAQVLFTVEMHRRMGDSITVNAVHPGIVNTDLFNRNVSPFVKNFVFFPLGKIVQSTGLVYTCEKGASTAIYLATTSKDITSSGGYFADCKPKPTNPVVLDRDLALEWWEASSLEVGLEP